MLRALYRITAPFAVVYVVALPGTPRGAVFETTAFAQRGPESKAKPPAKGTAIVVSGCIRDSTIEETGTGRIFRLTGDKKTLKELMQSHDGHVDDVSGVLKSELLQTMERSKRIGKTRISIGATESRNTPAEGFPILSIKSFEHTGGMCKA